MPTAPRVAYVAVGAVDAPTAVAVDRDPYVYRTDPQQPGRVVGAATLAALEEAARQPQVKGVHYDRGEHRLGADMERWARGQDPADDFAVERLQINSPGCNDPAHPCKKRQRVAAPGDVLAACKRLVARLPEAFRGAVRPDAEDLAAMLIRLCPEAETLTLQIEIIGNNACTRWHQDHYVGRVTITYAGPGTWMVDDASVRFDQLKAALGVPTEVSNPAIVPRDESIHKPPANAVALIKRSGWPGIPGTGLVHKAPDVPKDARGRPVLHRLLLKVDMF